MKRFDLDQRIEERRDDFEKALNDLGRNSLDIVRGVGNAVAATLTILVLTILMLLSGPRMLRGGLGALSPPTAHRVRHVAADCAKAVTGYMAGNLLISVIAGLTTFIVLTILGVPFAGVLGLWVAFADLIPLANGAFDFLPGNGLYVDLDGSTNDAGILTADPLALGAGNYALSSTTATTSNPCLA